MTARKTKGGLEVAIDLLSKNVSEVKSDVKEIKADMSDVKSRLCVIESKTGNVEEIARRVNTLEVKSEDSKDTQKWNFERLSAFGALIVSITTAVIMYFKHA
jgi:hypothetical protein